MYVEFFMLYFPCCINITSLSVIASSAICLEYFCKTRNMTFFILVVQLEMTIYIVICLCLFRNYLSESKLNCLLIFLLIYLICILHKLYCTIKFSIAFHFHCHYLINFVSSSFIRLILHHLFLINCINKLYGVDKLAYKIG